MSMNKATTLLQLEEHIAWARKQVPMSYGEDITVSISPEMMELIEDNRKGLYMVPCDTQGVQFMGAEIEVDPDLESGSISIAIDIFAHHRRANAKYLEEQVLQCL